MISYTLHNEDLVFNSARQKATCCLEKTLDELYGKSGISEKIFAGHWLERMSEEESLFEQGWYCPPPYGIAVLSDERLNFDSLRNEEYWPSNRQIDWQSGFLYAYCSPVDRKTGYIGDMSVTLYFGKDERIREHFCNCRGAAQDIFEHLKETKGPAELYDYSLKVFESRGLRSNVISRTDSMPSNLGHSFTHLKDPSVAARLGSEEIKELSSSRNFLNENAGWQFETGGQFTVEPQLLSLADPSFPKVTHHFVVRKTDEGFIVCNDIDGLLNKYHLI